MATLPLMMFHLLQNAGNLLLFFGGIVSLEIIVIYLDFMKNLSQHRVLVKIMNSNAWMANVLVRYVLLFN
jgi:hypothetical protein